MKPPKSGSNTAKTFRNTAVGLNSIERKVRIKLQSKDLDDNVRHYLQEFYLRVSDAADRKLINELKARQMLNELRDADMTSMTDERIEKMIEGIIRSRGFRSVNYARRDAVNALVRNGQPREAAQMLVDQLIPAVHVSDKATPTTRLNHSWDRIEEDMDEAKDLIEECLSPSGGPDAAGDGHEDPDQMSALSDDVVNAETEH